MSLPVSSTTPTSYSNSRNQAQCSPSSLFVARSTKSLCIYLPSSSELIQAEQYLQHTTDMGKHIITKFNVDINVQKIMCLNPGCWINDEIINFFMQMLLEKNNCCKSKQSFFLSSFFMERLLCTDKKYKFDNVRNWTKTINIYDQEHIFIPVNVSNTHWTLVVVSMLNRTIYYYDSCGKSGLKFMNAVLRWLGDVINSDNIKYRSYIFTADWQKVNVKDIPTQSNGYDCGIFVMMYAYVINEGVLLCDSFAQSDLDWYRREISCSVIVGTLNQEELLSSRVEAHSPEPYDTPSMDTFVKSIEKPSISLAYTTLLDDPVSNLLHVYSVPVIEPESMSVALCIGRRLLFNPDTNKVQLDERAANNEQRVIVEVLANYAGHRLTYSDSYSILLPLNDDYSFNNLCLRNWIWFDLECGNDKPYHDDVSQQRKSPDPMSGHQSTQHSMDLIKRVILLLDGETNNLASLMREFVDLGYNADDMIELIKLSAACSKTIQPNDKMKGFMILHQFYLSQKFKRMSLDDCQPPAFYSKVMKIIAGVPASSRRVFEKYFTTLELIVSTAFTVSNCQRGWQQTGIWPFNVRAIMANWPKWGSLEPIAQDDLLKLVVDLALEQGPLGHTSDVSMEQKLGHILGPIGVNDNADEEEDVTHPPPKVRATSDKPLNQWRTTVLSNPGIRQMQNKRNHDKQQKAFEKEEIKEQQEMKREIQLEEKKQKETNIVLKKQRILLNKEIAETKREEKK